MKLTIRWLLVASLALAACGDAPGGDTPAATEAPAPVTTSTQAVDSDDDVDLPTTTAPITSDTVTSDTVTSDTVTSATVASDTGATITIENFSFGEPVTVGVGDPVTVVNEDGVTHTWTSDDGVFDSGTLGPGESFEYAFEEPGEYAFFCEIHPGMTGAITVTG